MTNDNLRITYFKWYLFNLESSEWLLQRVPAAVSLLQIKQEQQQIQNGDSELMKDTAPSYRGSPSFRLTWQIGNTFKRPSKPFHTHTHTQHSMWIQIKESQH